MAISDRFDIWAGDGSHLGSVTIQAFSGASDVIRFRTDLFVPHTTDLFFCGRESDGFELLQPQIYLRFRTDLFAPHATVLFSCGRESDGFQLGVV